MHSLPDIRINDCGLADYPPGSVLGPRTLPDHELVWIERGDCRWEFDGQVHVCLPGSVLYCPPKSNDRWVWDTEHFTRHGYLHFDFADALDDPLPMRRDCPRGDVLRPLLRQAVWLASMGGNHKDRLAATALRQALIWYITGFVGRAGQPSYSDIHPVLLRALRTLRRRWGDGPKTPPSIADWASESGVSRGHLARICRQELNVTPRELLRYLRLDHGLLLLARTNTKVQQISEQCGFQSSFHFSRCCKQTYGQSPRALRNQIRAGGDLPLNQVLGLRRMTQFIG